MVTAGVGLFEWCVENFGLLVNSFVDPIIHVHTYIHVHRGTGWYTQVYYFQYTGNNITYIIHPGAHECVHTVRRFPHTVCTVHVHLCVKVQENL